MHVHGNSVKPANMGMKRMIKLAERGQTQMILEVNGSGEDVGCCCWCMDGRLAKLKQSGFIVAVVEENAFAF